MLVKERILNQIEITSGFLEGICISKGSMNIIPLDKNIMFFVRIIRVGSTSPH